MCEHINRRGRNGMKPTPSFTTCVKHNSISRGNNRVRGSSKSCSFLKLLVI